MNEAAVRLQVSHALKALGYRVDRQPDAIICHKCGTMIVPPSGKPDLTVVHPTERSFYVEVKVLRAGETSFPFGDISEQQRGWLDAREEEGFGNYLALGIIRQHGKVQRLDHLYLVDWLVWKTVESWVTPHQASIPLSADRCRSKVLKERGYTILEKFLPWEAKRGGGLWHLPILGGLRD